MRLDQFLDAVCLFRSRSAAAKAINTGRVRVNGGLPKPSQRAEVGAEIEIVMQGAPGEERVTRVRVVAVPAGSVSKKDARDCYDVIGESA